MADFIKNIASAIEAAQPLFNEYSGMHFLPCQLSGHKDANAYRDSRRGARQMDEFRQRQNYKLQLERLGRQAEFEGQLAAKRRDFQQKILDEEAKILDGTIRKHTELAVALEHSAAQLKDTMEHGQVRAQQELEQYAARRHHKSQRIATEAAAKSRSKLERDFVKRQAALQKEARKGKIDKTVLQLKTAQLQGDMVRSLQQQQYALEMDHMKRAARDGSKIKALEELIQKQLRQKQVAQLKELRLTQAHFKAAEARLQQLGYTMPALLRQASAPKPAPQQRLGPLLSSLPRPQTSSARSQSPSRYMAQPVTQQVSITQVLGGLACLTGRALDLAGSALIQAGSLGGPSQQNFTGTEDRSMPGSFD